MNKPQKICRKKQTNKQTVSPLFTAVCSNARFLLPLYIDALLKSLKPGRKPGMLGCYEPERVKVKKVEEEVSLLFVTSIYS